MIFTKDIKERLIKYNLNDYMFDVEHLGLDVTWDRICHFIKENAESVPSFLDVNNFGELYEIGLAIQDKILKKKSGQYYTPDDVAKVMSEWLYNCEGEAVCDVACGTGKLILTYLDLIGYDNARELISRGNLYLYDNDDVALKICKTIIFVKYGLDIANYINTIHCDFLDRSISLPNNCKVISNPPYAKIENFPYSWEFTAVLDDTKEFYSAFMEKIFIQAKSTVIITPFSFISGNKFYSLRRTMSSLGRGFMVAFDNVPGNIFCGRKHGIFNTNTANSVRAAITVMTQDKKQKGFRVSPLIRFKNNEREKLLTKKTLELTLPSNYQIVDETNDTFKKIDANLNEIFCEWVTKSKYKVKDIIGNRKTEYLIDMPNTCRYFTTASSKKLNRAGSITMYLQNEDDFYFLYCFINSSFAYWWWRVFDGGIVYPIGLLNTLPLPSNLLSDDDKTFFKKIAKELIDMESSFIITKVNAGAAQENIKFPEKYRLIINEKILSILGFKFENDIFRRVHANGFFE